MTEQPMLTADSIGAAARFDPQLRIPRRPRLRRGLVISAEPDQVVVTGTPKKQLFRGRSAADLLPALLDLLDGAHTHGDLAVRLGRPEEIVFKALSLLWASGVIEEGPPEAGTETAPVAGEVDDRLADFLSRVGSATEANASWEQAAARLHHASVEIFGDPGLAVLLEEELSGSLPVRRGEGGLPSEGTTLAVWAEAEAADRTEDERDGAALADHCWEKGLPLLRLRVHGRKAALGPLADPSITPCLECLSAEDASDERTAAPGDHRLAAALFARDLFAMVSRTTPSPLPMRWRVVDLETLGHQDASSATRPGCPRCSAAEAPAGTPLGRASLATRFEASVAMPPKEFADLKAHQMHYKPSNLALQRISRTWPVAQAVELPLPAHHRLDTDRPVGPAALDAGAVSLILSVTAGVKADDKDKVARWTASGGNIGSVTAYAVVRDILGLSPGVYGYVATEHRLARLSSSAGEVTGDAPVTLVLTGDFPKVARKYSAFALRIVLLDSGCAQATARAAAHTLGINLAPRPHWDDEAVATALGINPDVEPITAVIDLGGSK
ncbi:nitroreductase family protein [Streptomyces sp. NPDC090021]|uniref:nitroreductase family protein n=1 Tax=Streptomyces sp. NPDC090021 TaxID=3365919 RepID=UPI0037F982D3